MVTKMLIEDKNSDCTRFYQNQVYFGVVSDFRSIRCNLKNDVVVDEKNE